jgi:hypothetical protein
MQTWGCQIHRVSGVGGDHAGGGKAPDCARAEEDRSFFAPGSNLAWGQALRQHSTRRQQ